MGIRNFSKFMNGAVTSGLVYTISPKKRSQVLMIDLMSTFYGILKQWQNGDGVVINHDKAAECAFKRLIINISHEELSKMDEIFIAIDISAPIMKEKTQQERRTKEKCISYSDRFIFYKCFVKHFIEAMADNRVKITFAKSIEDEKYPCLGYEFGEGEYIIFDYIRKCIETRDVTTFTIIGNDNDIPLLATVFNTVYEHLGVCVSYTNIVGLMKSDIAWRCSNYTYLMNLLFRVSVLGNDYIPNIISGTEIQLAKLSVIRNDMLNNAREIFASAVFNKNESNTKKKRILTDECIEHFSYMIYEALKTIAQSPFSHADCGNGDTPDEGIQYVRGFIIICVWYFFYVINLLESRNINMYDNFGTVVVSEKHMNINSHIFTEAININGGSKMKFHVDRLFGNGKLNYVIKSTLTTIFTNTTI